MTSTRRYRTARLAGWLLLTGVTAGPAAGQATGPMLIALTLNTGAVIIVEPKYESSTEIKVYNLDTGEEESFTKAKGYRKVSATEAKYLAGTMATKGQQPERLEALFARPLTSAAPSYSAGSASTPTTPRRTSPGPRNGWSPSTATAQVRSPCSRSRRREAA